MGNHGPRKSPTQGVIPLELLCSLISDLQRKYPEDARSLARDILTIRSRVASEGQEFLTKTLPKLGKAFDRALETGRLEVPREFKRAHGNPAIPAFLQGMLNRCFAISGDLGLPAPSVIADIRQVLFMFYKLELPYSDEQSSGVIQKFVDTEAELREQSIPETHLIDVARGIVHDVLEGFDPKDIKPRHGPGAVATGEKMEDKWVFSRLYDRIHQSYPYYEYFMIGSRAELLDRYKWYKGLTRLESGTSRVVLVPKDSRGPRLISCEPLEYQYIQQGISQVLVRHLEGHALTGGRINFHDQSINAREALIGSEFRYNATIDLKDASDRVSLDLVRTLFPERIFRYLYAARSSAAQLPDGSVIELAKFAPMGSALCFPVEALCFWALCVAGIQTRKRLLDCSRVVQDVFVYGDDIVVPKDEYDTVVRALESAGLRVNADKCFRQGYFRESCGTDAYFGVPVTPTKIHTVWSGSFTDGTVLASYAAYANDFARKQYTTAAQYIRDRVGETYGTLPYGTSRSGFPCIEVPEPETAEALNKLQHAWRWNSGLQRFEFRVLRLVPKSRRTRLKGWPRALRALTGAAGDRPDVEVAPRQLKVARRWTAV